MIKQLLDEVEQLRFVSGEQINYLPKPFDMSIGKTPHLFYLSVHVRPLFKGHLNSVVDKLKSSQVTMANAFKT